MVQTKLFSDLSISKFLDRLQQNHSFREREPRGQNTLIPLYVIFWL